jgi:hypothetical protein
MTRTTYPRWALVIDRTPEDRVVAERISKNVAMNDRQVVLFLRGGKYYGNDLDTACQTLTAGETRLVLSYSNTGSQKLARVCETNALTVERQTSRLGCGLGRFHPITAEEAAALTGQPVAAPVRAGPRAAAGLLAASDETSFSAGGFRAARAKARLGPV